MSGIDQYQREQIDRDILAFVRESAHVSPVTVEALLGFLRDIRRRKVTEGDVRDRVVYLGSAEYLQEKREWVRGVGELVSYVITADGIDVMDGVTPPRGWQGK